MSKQNFTDTDAEQWFELEHPVTQLLSLAEPVPQGSIHQLKMAAGSSIPIHCHLSDEYVYVLSGTIETGRRECKKETF